jgi:hypothetical protein
MKKVWIGLLSVTSLVSVFFLAKTSCQLSAYFSLNREAQALSTSWSISEKSPSAFALQVSYLFDPVTKDPLQGVMEFSKPYFLNHPSAQRAIDSFSQKSWNVFYNEKDPTINSLQKIFPFKECLQSLLTLGVFVYFLFFRKIMERANQEW